MGGAAPVPAAMEMVTPVDPVAMSPGGPMAGQVLASNYVINMSIEIQKGFRRKMLTILFLQLALSMVVGLSLRYIPVLHDEFLIKLFPAQSLQTLVLGALCLVALPMMSYVRERHPWNLIFLTLWTITWGTFMAAAQVVDGMVKSNSLFFMMGAPCIGVGVLLVLCTCLTTTDEYTGQKVPMSFRSGGWIAWIVMITVSAIFAATGPPNMFEHGGHVVGALLVASALFAWITYDAAKLCERMQPDEFMKAVVYFYTDFLMVCCCCMLMGCVSSGAT